MTERTVVGHPEPKAAETLRPQEKHQPLCSLPRKMEKGVFPGGEHIAVLIIEPKKGT